MKIHSGMIGLIFILWPALFCGLVTVAQEETFPTNGMQKSDVEELFVHRVLPIFEEKCLVCHGNDPDKIRGGFDMRTLESIMNGGESGEPSVIPGKPDASPLISAIEWENLEMPPKENDRLTSIQIGFVRQWIAGGAPWPDQSRRSMLLRETSDKWNDNKGVQVETSGGLTEDWTNRRYDPKDLWSYQPLWNDDSGILDSSERNPIDVLIEKRLAEAGLGPVKRADRRTLLRRLTFDLTGLPPTRAEIRQFLSQADTKQNFAKQIDRLLASPRYGENWARHWLDVVRYADSSGFANDFLRANAWRYRDYVIRSFNSDKPYDQFLREQIAGDEINPDDPESLIAVGYLRMGPWEHTSMSVAAVTRQHFLDDITNSVGVTFLAHELRCASCHDHKFDPIPTRDYYRMQAVFAPTQFVDREVGFLDNENVDGIEESEKRIKRLQQIGGVKSLTTIPNSQWPVKSWDADSEVKGHAKVNKKRKQILTRELKRFKPFAFSVYSGPDRNFISNKPYALLPQPNQKNVGQNAEAAIVRILTGGSLQSPAQQVSAGVLSAVESETFKSEMPQSMVGRRAALANWLTSREHPLTARVIANRVWQFHFGKGLAANPNNFGVTGSKPTHPELLDFLARYLIENDWSIKQLNRLILTSDAWQRSSEITDSAMLADPDNSLLSFFSPRRISAEELRDSMLFVSGEMNTEMGGIPIRPEINLEVAMQPRHIMGSVAPAYQPSAKASQRNRRTIYAERIRTLRDPMLEVFNQPGPDTSCEARDSSTITPQAFTLLNSQNSHDRALSWASQLSNSHPGDLTSQINAAFNAALARDASPEEIDSCKSHFARSLAYHQETEPQPVEPPVYVIRQMVEEMTGQSFYWVEDLDVYAGSYQPDLKPWDVTADVRALADVCLVLFNSNEFVYVY